MFLINKWCKALFGLTVVILSMGGVESAYASPFTNPRKVGDLMMVMAPAYAWGMTIMEKDWDGTLQLAESLLASQVVVEGIKMLELERRPNGSDKKSFPSGHAAGSFTGAMFVHKRYGWKPALMPYTMAVITGWSRVYVKGHYVHDIIGGAAVSALFTWLLVDKYMPEGVSVDAGPQEFRLGFSTRF